jgi:threonine/homoserine/homoserine lactone efflux protein
MAYDVLRVTGAVVLVFLGSQALWRVWRERHASDADQLAAAAAAASGRRTSSWAAFSEGMVVQLANPKIAVFMLAFYPQFLPAGAPVLASTAVLAMLQVGVETGLYLLLLAGVGRARGWLQLPKVRHRLEATSGTVLIGLGVRVATAAR